MHRHPDAPCDRPELADRQRLNTLVGADEPPEHVRVEPAVRMRHERPGQSVDARIALERPLGQLGKLPVEAGRQIVADLTQLFIDDVEVVDQPLRGRSDRAFFPDGLRDRAIRVAQHASVVLDARQQRAPLHRPAQDTLGPRQALGVLLEALGAEELRPDRFLARPAGRRRGGPGARWRAERATRGRRARVAITGGDGAQRPRRRRLRAAVRPGEAGVPSPGFPPNRRLHSLQNFCVSSLSSRRQVAHRTMSRLLGSCHSIFYIIYMILYMWSSPSRVCCVRDAGTTGSSRSGCAGWSVSPRSRHPGSDDAQTTGLRGDVTRRGAPAAAG